MPKWKDLENLVTKAFQGKNTTMNTDNNNTNTNEPSNTYTSIEHYSQVTGKRFRMLKEQKERNLTREEAFAEIYLNGAVSSPVAEEEPPPEFNA